MNCPQKKRQIRPSRCLTCEYCGGFNNGGVLCFKANRKLNYDFIGKEEQLFQKEKR